MPHLGPVASPRTRLRCRGDEAIKSRGGVGAVADRGIRGGEVIWPGRIAAHSRRSSVATGSVDRCGKCHSVIATKSKPLQLAAAAFHGLADEVFSALLHYT